MIDNLYKSILYKILFICLSVCLLMLASACSERQDTETYPETEEIVVESYSEYVQKEADIHFSFIYPDHFGTYQDEIHPGYAAVWFTHYTEEDETISFGFDLTAYKVGLLEYNNAEEMYELYFEKISAFDDTDILQNTVFDNGVIHGNLMEYSYKLNLSYIEPPSGVDEDKFKIDVVRKEVWFDYSGYMWDISLMASVETYEFEIQAFDTILDSFKVID